MGRADSVSALSSRLTRKRQQEQLKVVSFLPGLDDHYASAKNQILSSSELPSPNVAFSRLTRIPVQVEASHDEDKVAFAVFKPSTMPSRGRGKGRGGAGRGGGRPNVKKEDRYCEYCNVAGHTEDKCWQKHGKPDWAKQMHNSNAKATLASPIPPPATAGISSPRGNTVTLSHADFEHLLQLAQSETTPP